MTRVLLILLICLAIHAHQTDAFWSELFFTLKAIYEFASELKTIGENAVAIQSAERSKAEAFEDVSDRLDGVERNLLSISQTGSDVADGIRRSIAEIKNVSRSIHNIEENLSSISRTASEIAIGIGQLNGAMKDISRKLYNVEENLIHGIDQLRVTLLHRLPLQIQHDARLQQLTIRINEVNDVYDNFLFYTNASHSYEPTTLIRFMTDLVGDSSKLNNAIDSVFDQLLSNEQISPNLLSVIMAVGSQGEDNRERHCGKISVQQKLFKIYQTIMLTEMQAYAMNVYAFGVLKQVHNVSYTGELDKLETRLKQRCEQYFRSMQSAMSTMSTEIKHCQSGKTCIDCIDALVEFYKQPHDYLGFSRLPQIADVEKNMVVTGVRIVVENHMLHLQIEQGKLMPFGEIETVDQPWKPINQSSEWVERWPDSGESWLAESDDTIAPDNFVVTGLKFTYIIVKGHPFNRMEYVIGVHATKYNSDTGNLEPSNSTWISDARSTLFQRNTSTVGITLMDIRPISMEPRFALSGVGYYLGGKADGSDSWIGLRLFGLNIASQMKSDLS